MLFLMVAQGHAFDNEQLRIYQRMHWGKASGDTCVIELSGVASRKLKSNAPPFLKERIGTMREHLMRNKPALVLFYGTNRIKPFEEVAGCSLASDRSTRRGETVFAFAPHPVAFGRKDTDWINLAQTIRSSLGGFKSDCPKVDVSSTCS